MSRLILAASCVDHTMTDLTSYPRPREGSSIYCTILICTGTPTFCAVSGQAQWWSSTVRHFGFEDFFE
jgi:hypothetical protein